MRFPLTLLLTTLITVSAVKTRHDNVLARRQHHPQRSLIDLCISTDALAISSLLGLGLIGDLHLCLCLKDLDLFLETDLGVRLTGLLGRHTLVTEITALLQTSPDTRRCTFPEHSHRICTNDDPCHYGCDENYTQTYNSCECLPPFSVCNGVCGKFTHGCPSPVPRSLKSRKNHGGAAKPKMLKLRMRKKRVDHVTTDTSIDSSLLVKLSDLSNTVISLRSFSLILSTTTATNFSSSIYDTSVNSLVQATIDVLKSPSVFPFISNINALAHINTLFISFLDGCGCVESLNLQRVVTYLETIAIVSSDLQVFCAYNPVVSSSTTEYLPYVIAPVGNTTTLNVNFNIPPNSKDTPITIRLDKLLAELGLSGAQTAVTLGKLGAGIDVYTDNLLDDFDIGPRASVESADTSSRTALNSNLLVKLDALSDLVIDLKGFAVLLPPASSLTSGSLTSLSYVSIDSNLVSGVVQLTASILRSPTVSSLVTAITDLATYNDLALTALDECGCVNSLALGPLVAALGRVADATLELQSFCGNNPIVFSSMSTISSSAPTISGSFSPSQTFTSPTEDVPIVIGLDRDLATLGLSDLTTDVAIDGAGYELSTVTNDLLDDAGVGPHGVLRRVHQTHGVQHQIIFGLNSSTSTDLLALTDKLIDGVLLLRSTYVLGFGISSTGMLAGFNANCLGAILDATKSLLSSSSISLLLSNAENLTNTTLMSQNFLDAYSRVNYPEIGQLVNCLGSLRRISNDIEVLCGVALGAGYDGSGLNSGSGNSANSGSLPLVIGLSRLLSALGLSEIQSGVIVNGLGNGINAPADDILDNIALGPHDIRRSKGGQ